MDYQGGGGFGANSPSSANPSTPSSNQKSGRKAYDEQTLIPVTIRMILASTPSSEGGGALTLDDGRPLHHVKFVAAVRDFENQSTNISYNVEDGTGLVEVKQWLDDNDCSAVVEMKETAAKDAQYIRIIGQVKDYDGKKSVVAHSIRKILKGDELTHHYLEVVYSGERAKQANRIGPAPPMMNMGMAANSTFSASTPLADAGGDGGIKDQVLNFIKQEGETSDEGANVHKCFKLLSNHSENEVRMAIEDLAAEGHIYSTINEDHYKFAM